ncbi:type IV toxin-antitoxin system YeeU family antitoxin [Hafnia sp. HMSC23F03]|uniref:type IV toxin-antitoxin system YeeU family antitoxin n=1 Tax=Hafnia sp. HMSC23F03 TaxID=1581059 RepID=UPI0008A3EB78|nr:type IV toxin-antitoxin system YeeU family antitoxin [Hafnia sp. HMSC23F03]OFS08311.1 antitoxin YeeU [Hafnia sp. HMSC23F03]
MHPEDNPTPVPEWGLRRDIYPCFGARLVQEGNRLHYLADRAGFCGDLTPKQLKALNTAFPKFVKRMEVALKNGGLDPRYSRRFTLTLNGLTCEADTNGSYSYV